MKRPGSLSHQSPKGNEINKKPKNSKNTSVTNHKAATLDKWFGPK